MNSLLGNNTIKIGQFGEMRFDVENKYKKELLRVRNKLQNLEDRVGGRAIRNMYLITVDLHSLGREIDDFIIENEKDDNKGWKPSRGCSDY